MYSFSSFIASADSTICISSSDNPTEFVKSETISVILMFWMFTLTCKTCWSSWTYDYQIWINSKTYSISATFSLAPTLQLSIMLTLMSSGLLRETKAILFVYLGVLLNAFNYGFSAIAMPDIENEMRMVWYDVLMKFKFVYINER